jgi:hypothetical protein
MSPKKKYYDIESEYQSADSGGGESRSFLDWITLARSGKLDLLRKKEEQLRIIEQFVKENPKIKPVDKDAAADFQPVEDKEPTHEEVVSETLARIYEQQGFFSRAREVYRKLSLLYPEKSDYFASLIQETKDKENELKK